MHCGFEPAKPTATLSKRVDSSALDVPIGNNWIPLTPGMTTPGMAYSQGMTEWAAEKPT
jgi:hypothetical protein